MDDRVAELRHLLPFLHGRCLVLGEGAEILAKGLASPFWAERTQVNILSSEFPAAIIASSGVDSFTGSHNFPFPETSLLILLTQGGSKVIKAKKRELAALGYNNITCYRLAPSRQEVRWIIPAGSPRVAAASLALYQPSLLTARLKKTVAKVLSRVGLAVLWAPDLAMVAVKGAGNQASPQGLGAFLAKLLGRPVELALFTGTPGYIRKPTVQVMESSGRVLAYAKLAVNEQTKALLANEYVILKRLHELNPQHFSVPRILHYGEVGGRDLLVLESAKKASDRGPHTLGIEQSDFLAEIWQKTASTENFENTPAWREVKGRYDKLSPHLKADWRRRLSQGLKLLETRKRDLNIFVLAHRDFTPWNTYRQGNRLVVFDWEMAREPWPVFYDLFHFIIQPEALFNRTTGCKIFEKLTGEPIQNALRCLRKFGIEAVPWELYLLFYLCDVSLFYHEMEYLEQGRGGEERPRMFNFWGEMLDLLLQKEQLS